MQAVKERFPNIVCLLLTNGRSFSIPEITAKAVHSLPKHTTAAIPIHAANADLHDRITQSEGSFRQTMHGIRNILHTDFHIEIRIVVFRENLQEMLPIAKLICELPKRVFVVHFMAAEMCGNAAVNLTGFTIYRRFLIRQLDYNIKICYNSSEVHIDEYKIMSMKEII